MQAFRTWFDPERWAWFAAGDDTVPSQISLCLPSEDNSPRRVLWEVGWAFAIPLAFAALVQLVLGQ